MAKERHLKSCSFCERQVYKLANPSRGLCAACYYREKRNGELAYKPLRVRGDCSVDGCGKPHVAKGYCDHHLRRFMRHGVADHVRFDKWGHIDKHPLAHVYYHMRRNYRDQVCDLWLSDFWAFVEQVGERPSAKHRFCRKNPGIQFQAGNVAWQPPKLDVSVTDREGANTYGRAYRAANPEIFKDQYLRKKFGITLADYQRMMTEQGGVCLLCDQPETAKNRHTGLPMDLAVDHCHAGGHVRGLLCGKCNSALGGFRDNVETMKRAIAYLEKHSLPATPD